MRRLRPSPLALAAGLLLVLPAAPAAAEQRIGLRVGDHPGFGRFVFEGEAAAARAYRVEREGERLRVRFTQPATLDLHAARRLPRNATGITAAEQGVDIALRSPEVRVRHFVLGTRVVVDVLDAPRQVAGAAAAPSDTRAAARAVPQGADTPAAPVPPRGPIPSAASENANWRATPSPSAPGASDLAAAAASMSDDAAPPIPARPTSATLASAPPASVPQPAGPSAAAAVLPPAGAAPVRLVFGSPGQSRVVLLPFGEDVGIAVLRRGDTVLVVIDAPRPLNLAALRGDPVFGGMEARAVPGGNVLMLRLAEPAVIEARRRDGAWALTALPAPAGGSEPRPPELEATADPGGPQLLVRAASAGRIVAVTDPETGLPMLVGTLRSPDMALPQLRRLPEADLLPSLLGLATLARSDRFAVRVVTEGFLITAAGGGTLALDPAVAGSDPARTMTRLFDIPSLPVPVLHDRLRAEHAAVRAAPPLARTPLRRAAAETLLALGMPQEAQGMLAIALAEDPRAAADPILAALSGAAALLGGRLADAEGLARTDLPERDETLLWRALLAAARGESRAAAPQLAATLPLALTYPENLRTRLLSPVAAALAEAGDAAALRRLVAAAGERRDLDFARAALAEAEGRTDAALVEYDAVARGRDRLARARALRRAVEIRLAAGALTKAQAAEALESALFAWRGDGLEISARLRIAELRTEAGDPRAAMGVLQETETLFPDQADAVRSGLQSAFLAALVQEPPLGAVALHDAHPGLLPADARGETAVATLAERLVALDLPDRAAALLGAAMQRAAAGSAQRAELGLRLAQLHLGEGDAAAALGVLRQSAADALPAELARERGILAARAEARLGNRPVAIAALQALGADAAEPLVEILAEAQDWAGAARALAAHLQASLPATPAPLAEAQARNVLRQAALLGLVGDSTGLSALAAQYGPRLAAGPLADAFGALTADPMRGLADLPRLQRELRLFRALPSLEPLRAASLGTR